MRLAYFSPLPPERSGIADYSRDLLPALAEHVELTLFHPQPAMVDSAISARFELLPLADYAARRFTFDLPLYHIGNSTFHSEQYRLLQQHPGVVVLHDINLQQFLHLQQHERELGYVLGAAAGMRQSLMPQAGFAHPMTDRLLDLSLGVAVHSHYAATQIEQRRAQTPLLQLPMPIAATAPQPLPPAPPFIFGAFGRIASYKRLDLCLNAFAALCATGVDARFVIVGEAGDVDVAALIAALPAAVAGRVVWHGYVADFEQMLATVHVVLNLRHPTLGETSAAALRALGAGRPLIVFDHGWYSELPDAVALKAPPHAARALPALMGRALADYPAMAAAAQRYVREQHAPASAARVLVDFCHQLLQQISSRFAGGET